MGTASYVLAGREGSMTRSFGTICHGAGRRLSRTAAKQQVKGEALRRELEAQGIAVRAASTRGLAEEAPIAYKDVDAVVASSRTPGSPPASRGCGRSASSRARLIRGRAGRGSAIWTGTHAPGAPAPGAGAARRVRRAGR